MDRVALLGSVKELVLPVLGAMGYDLVEVKLLISHGRRTLRIFIDKKGCVNVDDCARASKAVGRVLDEENLFRGRYYLEVSSPGAERLLRTPEDFERFVGRKAFLRLRASDQRPPEVTGRIEGYERGLVTFKLEDGSLISVPFDEIRRANLSL